MFYISNYYGSLLLYYNDTACLILISSESNTYYDLGFNVSISLHLSATFVFKNFQNDLNRLIKNVMKYSAGKQ